MLRTVADAIVEALQRHQITEIFGQSLPSALFLSAERAGIRQVVYRTENAGGAMADAAARLTGRISVIGAQNGPAATLLVPPFAEAMKASVPILALVQEVPTGARDRNAFQELDHIALFHGVTKWARVLTDPDRVNDYVDMAITAATTGRPGPVALMLPKNLLIAEAGPRSGRTANLGRFPLDPVRPDPTRISAAAQLLATARSPLVIAGGGVHLSGGAEALARLQDEVSLPIATTNMGKGSVAETHPLSMGVVGNAMGRGATSREMRGIIDRSDVILLVGARTNENGTDAWTLLPKTARIIHLDIDGQEIGRNYEALRLAGDARLGLTDLLEAITPEQRDARRGARAALEAELEAIKSRARAEVASISSKEGAIRPEQVMAALDPLLTETSVVVADASYSTLWVTGFLRTRRPGQRFLAPRGLAGLGWGFPMSIGAAAVGNGDPVVCLTGDGGFGHVWGELETVMRENFPVVLIVLNNSILGFQKHAELAQFGSHTSAIRFASVNHSAVAAAVGMPSKRIYNADELPSALQEAIASRAPIMLEVMTDENAHPPVTLWDAELAATRIEAGRASRPQ